MPKRLLYVGAGYDRGNPFPGVFDGYEVVRLDLDPETEPDVVMDALELAGDAVYRAQFDGVALRHTLEHFTEAEGATVLAGARHVMTSGGVIAVSVPNLHSALRAFAVHPDHIVYRTDRGMPIRALDMIYGWQWAVEEGLGHPLMSHKWGYTADTLASALAEAGFERVEVTGDGDEATEIRAVGVKP